MNLQYDNFNRIKVPDVYMVSQDRKSKIPIQVHNLRISMRDFEISEVTFDVYEDEVAIRDLYPWSIYTDTLWENLIDLTWLDISRSKNHSLLEGLRNIYIPDLGEKAYFQLTTPIETQESEKKYKTCVAKSLEHQLTQKDVAYFIINMGTIGSTDGVVLYDRNNPDKSLLDLALKNAPNWSVGEVDNAITFKSRSFEIDKSDIYSFLVDDVSSAYDCVFTFDTVNCKVNATAVENYGKDTDIHISARNLAKRITVESAEDAVYTRFYVEGRDGLDIRDVNLGSDYIEDYTYYNTPEWMGSQELCDKYSDYRLLRETQRRAYVDKQKQNITTLNQYYELMNRLPSNSDSVNWGEYGLVELRTMRDSYQNVVDTQAESGQNSPTHVNYQSYLLNKQMLDGIKAELVVRENEIDTVQAALDDIALELKSIVDVVDKDEYFTEDELEIFSSLEVNTDYLDSSYVVTDSMPDELIMDIKEELYNSAISEAYKVSQPQYSFKTELLNLFNIPEFQSIKSDFDLGSFITLSMRDNYHVRLRLIAIDIDFSDLNSLAVEFSNMTRTRDGLNDFMQLVKKSISNSRASITRSLNTGLENVQSALHQLGNEVRTSVTTEYLLANYASVGTLEAVNAKIHNIEAEYLTAENAAIMFLTADEADIKYANIEDLVAVNANIDNLIVDVGSINTLLNGNLTSENIHSLNLTAQNTTIENALIKNAMIDSVSANKVNSGTIFTNNVSIQSSSGNFLLQDNTIQISDSTRVRVQIGKDAANDYNMYLWDAQGKLMFDATGIKADGIKDKIIRNDMVSDTANIDASKINISTLFSVINNDKSHTLKGSKIYLDAQNQVLDVAFSELTTGIGETQDQVSTLQTGLNVVSGNISTIVSASELAELENGSSTFYSQYVATKQTLDSWELALANQSSTFSELLTEVSVNSAKISATPATIKAVVTSSYVNSLDSISSMRASIELNATGIANKVDKNGIITSINQSNEQVEIDANRLKIGTGTNFERGKIYTWENYVGKTWNEMIALANV